MPGKCTFQGKWTLMPEFENWLKPGKTKDMALCSICMKEFSISNSGVAQVKCHASGKMHATSAKQISKQTNLISQFCKPTTSADILIPNVETTSTNIPSCTMSTVAPKIQQPLILPHETLRDNITRAEIMYAFKLVASHSSMNFSNKSGELFAAMFPDSEIAKGFKMSNDKAAYIINHGLGPYYERNINDIMCNSEFLVAQFDESLNKVSQRGQMDLHVRYIDDDNLVQTKYVTSTFLGRANAENLSDLTSCFSDNSFIEKIIQLSMDGPAVNWKLLGLFKDELSDLPNNFKLFDIGSCGIHIVHGALKTGFQKSSQDIQKFIRSTYYVFKDSPARRAAYTDVTNSSVFPKPFVGIR